MEILRDKDGKLSSKRILALIVALNFIVVADVAIINGTYTNGLLDFVWYMVLISIASLSGNSLDSFIKNRWGVGAKKTDNYALKKQSTT